MGIAAETRARFPLASERGHPSRRGAPRRTWAGAALARAVRAPHGGRRCTVAIRGPQRAVPPGVRESRRRGRTGARLVPRGKGLARIEYREAARRASAHDVRRAASVGERTTGGILGHDGAQAGNRVPTRSVPDPESDVGPAPRRLAPGRRTEHCRELLPRGSEKDGDPIGPRRVEGDSPHDVRRSPPPHRARREWTRRPPSPPRCADCALPAHGTGGRGCLPRNHPLGAMCRRDR